MATARGGNEVHFSDTDSSVDMAALHGLNKNTPLPEEWTLPHEWNMEKREMFEVCCTVVDVTVF